MYGTKEIKIYTLVYMNSKKVKKTITIRKKSNSEKKLAPYKKKDNSNIISSVISRIKNIPNRKKIAYFTIGILSIAYGIAKKTGMIEKIKNSLRNNRRDNMNERKCLCNEN